MTLAQSRRRLPHCEVKRKKVGAELVKQEPADQNVRNVNQSMNRFPDEFAFSEPGGLRPLGSAPALKEPLFRSLWIAAVISYAGSWMQNVGAGWLMTQLTISPLMVSLVTAATTLPVFQVILPAGALADLVDRRRFLA